MNRSVWDDYFQKKYGNDSFYSDRLGAAMEYLERHIDDFNEGKIGIVGKSISAVGRPMMVALYRAYAGCPDDMVSHDYPVSLILQMARENEKNS